MTSRRSHRILYTIAKVLLRKLRPRMLAQVLDYDYDYEKLTSSVRHGDIPKPSNLVFCPRFTLRCRTGVAANTERACFALTILIPHCSCRVSYLMTSDHYSLKMYCLPTPISGFASEDPSVTCTPRIYHCLTVLIRRLPVITCIRVLTYSGKSRA
jgi:hypothetical protein